MSKLDKKLESFRYKLECILASDCRTPKGCLLDHDEALDSIIALVLSELPEERVLNKDNPQYVLGWNAYKAILKERLGE